MVICLGKGKISVEISPIWTLCLGVVDLTLGLDKTWLNLGLNLS